MLRAHGEKPASFGPPLGLRSTSRAGAARLRRDRQAAGNAFPSVCETWLATPLLRPATLSATHAGCGSLQQASEGMQRPAHAASVSRKTNSTPPASFGVGHAWPSSAYGAWAASVCLLQTSAHASPASAHGLLYWFPMSSRYLKHLVKYPLT